MTRARRSRTALPATLLACAIAAIAPSIAQDVAGTVFEDRNANGIRDSGEPVLSDVDVRLFGRSDATGAVDQTVPTAADGSYAFAPGDGCYLLLPVDPSGWRASVPRFDALPEGAAGYVYPVGIPRFGKIDHGLGHLEAGALRYTAMGDSIATNFDFCDNIAGNFLYSRTVRDRLQCVAPAATITLDQAAVKGEHTDDLLVDDSSDLNNVFRVIQNQPQLVSISMIGNDLLDRDVDNPTQNEINIAVEEVLDARQNLQEALSSMLSEVPGLDITLNTLYDNLADRCYGGVATTPFHRDWLPVIDRMLRELAWGQVRRVTINEVAVEFARENLDDSCTGYDQMICTSFLDGIHPTQTGYNVITEKLWEGLAGVNLGTRDALDRASMTGVDYGYLRRVRRLLPTAAEALAGASVAAPGAAFDDDDGGAVASIGLGLGAEEVRFRGFPDWFDEVRIVKVVAGVRYRTSGSFQGDLYRIEAAPTGQFRPPPGHAYTPTDWNFYTPIVGGGGPNKPDSSPDYGSARLLVVPQPASFREVSATLTKNPIVEAGRPNYTWPAITHDDLATTEIRVAAAPVGGAAGGGAVEVDAVWLDLYGWEAPRPGEAEDVRLARLPDGAVEVSFLPVAGADRYNLYWGRIGSLGSVGYDHGVDAPAGPECDAPVVDAGGGRSKIVVAPANVPAGDVYALVTAHVDDVESPAGAASDGAEIDRAESICR